jgi:uncharacterized protein
MITDLVQIQRLGQQKKAENSKFRAFLRRRRHSDRRLKDMAEEIEAAIDCTQCANCCREGEAGVTARDIAKLAKFLGMSNEEFRRDYTQRADDNELILKRTPTTGCVFLKDNLCTVYEARPVSCAHYPHLVRGGGSIDSRMWFLLDRIEYCPIVYNWVEKVKADVGFQKP